MLAEGPKDEGEVSVGGKVLNLRLRGREAWELVWKFGEGRGREGGWD